jgi:ferredoxin
MAIRILASECTGCGLCVENCPMKAVVPPEFAGRGAVPSVRRDRCTECVGHFAFPRCVALCPVHAVRRDLDHPEGRLSLLAKWFSLTGSDRYEWVRPPALESAPETGEPGD